MSKLRTALEAERFVITTELTPPKGTDLSDLFAAAASVRELVTAINLTDSHAARMSMAPLAVARLLADQGVEAILQVTGRDRNRIALQSDLLGAHALGIRNVVCMGGDPPSAGDHPDAKPVFDLSSAELLQAVRGLNGGHDFSGNALNQPTDLLVGAVVNPGADNLDVEVGRMREKVDAGARFFQTQAIYDAKDYEAFANRIHDLDVKILAGVIPLKSVKMARYLHEKVPGIRIPDALFKRLDEAADVRETSLDIAGECINTVQPLCAGAHLMTIGWEAEIPHILARAGIGDS
ncbi:MAG: methylenetetrahydrofolate reductase [Pseudomonadota bacterium]